MDAEQVRQRVHRLEDLQVEYAANDQFNDKLLVWFHPHRGGRSAQKWLKGRLKKTFPRADFFMPRYLGKIDAPIIFELASELLLLVAWVYESAQRNSRHYDEVVFVAYGEGILVTRKMLELSTDIHVYAGDPAASDLIHDSWDQISANCRTVYIARGTGGTLLRGLGHSGEQLKSWWRRLVRR